jgi:enediyne biosynthesis protein E4
MGSLKPLKFWIRQTVASFLLLTGLGSAQTPTAPPSTSTVFGRFVDATSRLGIHFKQEASPTPKKYLLEAMGSGVALFDYDNDGRLDLFLANGTRLADPTPKGTIPTKDAPKYWNRLYHQRADGTFEDVTEHAGVKGKYYSTGVAVGDYDNDGHEDLFVSGFGGSTLYHNNGDGTFTDVSVQAGVVGSGWATSAAWVDYDGDGLLDLIVLRYMEWDFDDLYCGLRESGFRSYCHPDLFKPVAALVYHNDGNGKFTESAKKAGLDKPGKGLGIAIADYDHDGKVDIMVANDSMPEFLFHNLGKGTFEEVGLPAGVALDGSGASFAGMGVDFTDYDNDGWPDVFITDLANQRYALFRNNGDESFEYASNSTGIAAATLLHSGWGTRFLDYDNDGKKDLFIVQSHVMDTIQINEPHLRYREHPMLLRNEDGKHFVDVSSGSGDVFPQDWAARGMAVGDINNDGKIDVVVTLNDGPAYVLMNETPNAGHWLSVSLTGTKSNRDGIGAQIKISTEAGDQYTTVTTAGSYQSSGDKRAHFGIGAAKSVKRVEIRWPGGIVQTLTDVKADQILAVTEKNDTAK